MIRSLLLIGLIGLTGFQAAAEEPTKIDFATDVAPILSDRCFHCHGPDAVNQDSAFRADTRENLFADLGGYSAIVPGDLAASELHLRIRSDDPDSRMPPPESKRSLSDSERAILDQWIREGAPYEMHWSFEPIFRPDVPSQKFVAAADAAGWDADLIAAWSNNPLDCFVGQKLLEKGLSPSPAADPSTLLRRASMTLTGLLPPQDLRERFLQNPTDENYRVAVNELLDSMDYAERQSLRWLDAARYADTDGYQNDMERTNWPWRDWVTKAFYENMPFDQFTIEQLAGDMLPNATPQQQLASAFNRNHRQNSEGGALAAEFFVENVIDRVETTSTVFLGLTFGCARCHDHKYDPLSQQEFYQLFGYFNNIGENGFGKGIDANPTLKAVSPLADVDPQWIVDVETAEANLEAASQAGPQRLAEWLVDVDPTKLDKPDEKVSQALKKPEKKRSGDEKNILQNYFSSIDQSLIDARAAFDAANKKLNDAGAPRATVMVMREQKGEPMPFYLLERGQYDAPVKEKPLSRGVPVAMLVAGETQPADRMELAKWIVSPKNPLTARVTVNRMWQEHFGTGLVKTTEDFGVQGETPSHRSLLDWLAAEFIESDWDVKATHRLIVTSAAYRQASHSKPQQLSIDPENRFLSHGPRFRADGFAIRDVALQASGLLQKQLGGPSVKPYQPEGLWAVVAANTGTEYDTSKGSDLYRKSIYTYWKRAVNPPEQTIFDAGGREVCNVRLRRTNTPLQALVMMNDPTFLESARKLAERILRQPGRTDAERLSGMYRLAMALEIDDDSMKVLTGNLEYFRAHFRDQPDDAVSLLDVGESSRDVALDVGELAAMTATAHLILNLDGFITIE